MNIYLKLLGRRILNCKNLFFILIIRLNITVNDGYSYDTREKSSNPNTSEESPRIIKRKQRCNKSNLDESCNYRFFCCFFSF